MRKQFLIYFLFISFFGYNQNVNPFVTNGFMGYSFSMPNFKPKGFERSAIWQGIEAGFGGMSFAFHQGQLRQIDGDSTVASVPGTMFNIGFKMGKDFTIGRNSFFSTGIKPYVQISATNAHVTDRITNKNVGSGGLTFSPGLQLKFSHIYLSAQYNASLLVPTTVTGGNWKYSIAKGYVGGLSFTIGIDNAFDLLVPRVFSIKGYNIEKKSYQSSSDKFGYNNTTGKYEKYREIVTTTITNYSPGQKAIALCNPFWGIGPSYSFKALRKRQAPTSMIGLNAGVRFWYLSLDAYYEKGETGTRDDVSKNDILIQYPQLRDYDFSAKIPSTNKGVRIGLNLSKIFAVDVNFQKDYQSKMVSKMRVPFTRINIFYALGQLDIAGTPTYTYNGASERLEDFQEKNDIVSSHENNPDYLTGSYQYGGWGVGVEVGTVFFNTTWYKYKNAPVLNHTQFNVGANIPLGRIFHSLRLGYI